MKILFVVPRYHTNMIGWIKALKAAGCDVEVDVIIKGATEDYSELQPEIFPLSSLSKLIMKLKGEGGANQPRGFPKIFKYYSSLKKRRPNVIIVRDISRWFALMAAMYAKILGIKVVIYSQLTMHTDYSEKRLNSINKTNNFFRSFWMTPIRGDVGLQGPVPEKLVYIPFVVDIHKREAYASAEVPRLLEIGKFVERKNHLLLLEALKNIKAGGGKFKLTIVGEISTSSHESHYNKIVNYIAENDLQDDVDIKVNVPHKTMDELFKATDIFILPATNEPASISVLEAVSYGMPVICSDTCGTRWYIQHKETGYMFEDNSVKDLQRALTWFFDYKEKEDLYNACIENARNGISDGNFISLFDQALQSHFQISLYK